MSDLSSIYDFALNNGGGGKASGRRLSRSSKGTQKSAASLTKVQPLLDSNNDSLELISNYESTKGSKNLIRMLSLGSDAKAFEPEAVVFANGGLEVEEQLNKLDRDGLSPLLRAVLKKDLMEVTYLLDCGADIDLAGKDGVTPLHVAVRTQNCEIVRLLLQRDANPALFESNKMSPLHIAALQGYTEIAEILLQHPKVDVNLANIGKFTPFHLACLHGDPALCELFLRKGADVLSISVNLRRPLSVAVYKGNEEACEMLIQAASRIVPSLKEFLDFKDSDGATVLHDSCSKGHEGIVDLLLRNGADFEIRMGISCSTPLHLAAKNGHLTVVELLVLYGVFINAEDSSRKTPLHYGAIFNHSRIAEVLLDNGADIEAKEETMGLTPFLTAVVHGSQQSAETLLNRGANIMATDASFSSCLHLAVKYKKAEMVEWLLKRNNQELLEQTDKDFRHAVHMAAALEDAQILQILLREGEHMSRRDTHEMTPLHVAAEKGSMQCVEELSTKDVQFSAILNDRRIDGMTPLHLAAKNRQPCTCLKLISKGADVTLKDVRSCTALHLAVMAGSLETVKALLDPLLPSTLDEQDMDKNTPLHVACRHSRLEILRFLLNKGADVTTRNNLEMTCLDVAIEWGANEVAKVLVKHERWKDVIQYCTFTGNSPMKKLIEKLPDVAEIVLDQCITYSSHPPAHEDFTVKFDWFLLNPVDFGGNERFFAPAFMALNCREKLLNHVVTQGLLRWKWMILGRGISFVNFVIFTTFVIMFSVLVVTERDKIKMSFTGFTNTLDEEEDNTAIITTVIPQLILIFMGSQLIKEMVQLFWLRISYIKEPSNLLDLLMIAMVISFILPYISHDHPADWQWVAGILGLLLAYINLTLALRRIGGIGLYVSMYVEVLATLSKVMFIFSSIIVGYTLVFYTLFMEQDNFLSVWLAILKTNMMMVGELDYSDIYAGYVANNSTVPGTNIVYVPFPELTGILFLLFTFMVSVALMNLLVGLAVGDIGSIQKTASLRALQDQALMVDKLEKSYPKFILKRLHRFSWEIRPNQNTLLKRFALAGMDVTGQDFINNLLNKNSGVEAEDGFEDLQNYERHRIERQDQRIRKLQDTIDAQSRLVRAIAEKLQINTE